MNPQFKRNLCRVFSLQKLIATPLILGLFILPMVDRYMAFEQCKGLFIAITYLWGVHGASNSMTRELNAETCDQQRRRSPWIRTCYRWFGATALSWYAGLICLFFVALFGWQHHKPYLGFQLVSLVLIGIALQAASMAFTLHTSRVKDDGVKSSPRRLWLWLVVSLVFGNAGMTSIYPLIEWNGQIYVFVPFVFYSSIIFAACAVIAVWRSMSNALNVHTLPWAWTLFAILLAFYCGAFTNHKTDSIHHIFPEFDFRDYRFYGIALNTMVILTYFNLLFEPGGPCVWQRIERSLRARNWRGFLERLPLWPSTLIISFIMAGLAMINLPSLNNEASCAVPDLFLGLGPLTLVLLLVRDVFAVHCINFVYSDRRALSRSLVMIYFCFMNLPTPLLTQINPDNQFMRYWVFPSVEYCLSGIGNSVFFDQLRTSAMVMALQAMTTFSLFYWQWRKTVSLQKSILEIP